MPIDTPYLIFLVVGMLLAFLAAVGASLTGFWLAGRLAGLFGPPGASLPEPRPGVDSNLQGPGDEDGPQLEEVPWLDEQGDAIPEDVGKNPDNWDEVKE